MVIKGEVKLSSTVTNRFSKKSWVDGAFFGELPLLGLGHGRLRHQHVYTVTAVVESDLTFLTRKDMDALEHDYPVFKAQVRKLATKRARRFGIQLERVTLDIDSRRRRMSVALDSADLVASAVEAAVAAAKAAAAAGTDAPGTPDAAAPAETPRPSAFECLRPELAAVGALLERTEHLSKSSKSSLSKSNLGSTLHNIVLSAPLASMYNTIVRTCCQVR